MISTIFSWIAVIAAIAAMIAALRDHRAWRSEAKAAREAERALFLATEALISTLRSEQASRRASASCARRTDSDSAKCAIFSSVRAMGGQ